MKQVIIEKTIELDHDYSRIDDLSCHVDADTTALSEGLQCCGNIEITGNGYLEDHVVPLHESIDLSIFAPFSKLSDQEQFSVQLNKYDLKLSGQELFCTFVFDVYGIVEKQENQEEASIDDLLDDETVVCEKVRYGVTYPNETYTSLSLRFGVEENVLRKLNRNKNLSGRMLILLPCS